MFSGSDTADLNACHTDQGDQQSGAGVIAAFEHAYYVTRSGDDVRALTTPDTTLPLADKIKAGIDSVPTGTTHCVQISTDDGKAGVALKATR
ncbi:hypothetical protein [Rhodococcus sp. BH4]|uniref:hypothetical protein n=1 Tax=Rhodococcus sp. BH4 TaxID=1807790 RepID=UPI001E30F0BF|nr:hypothetical protein [Rhodococcus sp. BH4]